MLPFLLDRVRLTRANGALKLGEGWFLGQKTREETADDRCNSLDLLRTRVACPFLGLCHDPLPRRSSQGPKLFYAGKPVCLISHDSLFLRCRGRGPRFLEENLGMADSEIIRLDWRTLFD